jgi:hypothetical protein
LPLTVARLCYEDRRRLLMFVLLTVALTVGLHFYILLSHSARLAFSLYYQFNTDMLADVREVVAMEVSQAGTRLYPADTMLITLTMWCLCVVSIRGARVRPRVGWILTATCLACFVFQMSLGGRYNLVTTSAILFALLIHLWRRSALRLAAAIVTAGAACSVVFLSLAAYSLFHPFVTSIEKTARSTSLDTLGARIQDDLSGLRTLAHFPLVGNCGALAGEHLREEAGTDINSILLVQVPNLNVVVIPLCYATPRSTWEWVAARRPFSTMLAEVYKLASNAANRRLCNI